MEAYEIQDQITLKTCEAKSALIKALFELGKPQNTVDFHQSFGSAALGLELLADLGQLASELVNKGVRHE